MSTIVKFVEPIELFFQPEAKQNSVKRQTRSIRPVAISEPDRRFWKPVVPISSPAFAMAETGLLALFLAFGILGIVSCFGELSHLLHTDALGHIAIQALGGALGL